jgi:glucuronosyltransferase
MRSFILLFLLSSLQNGALGENILYLNGVTSPSHHHYNQIFVQGLAAKGHNVTFVSVDAVKKTTPNVHAIHLEKTYEIVFGGSDGFDLLEYADLPATASIVETGDFYAQVCEGIIASSGLDTILNYPNDFKFGAVIFDFTFGPCLLPLMAKFNNPPLISISAFANPPYTTDLVGGQKYPAYIPHYAINYSSDMNFFQRFFNTYLYLVDWL